MQCGSSTNCSAATQTRHAVRRRLVVLQQMTLQIPAVPKIPRLGERVDAFISGKDPMREQLLFGIQKTYKNTFKNKKEIKG